MNILIVTPFYKQDKNIASVRWTNIAKRLARKHTVIVVTQPLDNDMDMTFTKQEEDGILVARLNQKTAYEKIAVKHFGGDTGDAWQTKTSVDEKRQNTHNQESFQRIAKNIFLFEAMKLKAKSYAKEICDRVLAPKLKIDVVITSACPFIEMLFGYELKKRLKCKWISDFRDLPFIKIEKDDEKRMKRIMEYSLRSADAILTVTPQGKVFLVENGVVDDADKIHVVTNGFSLDDVRRSTKCLDNSVQLVHTGSLYGGRRKADLLFEAIKLVKKTNPEFKFKLVCAGGMSELIQATARRYDIEESVDCVGLIPREDALNLQNQADILVAFVENMPGSLSAKLFEYALCKKPVVCITCGPGVNGDNTKFVQETNIGIAVEEEKGSDQIKLLADYLKKQAFLKVSGQKLEYTPDLEKLKEYDHDEIVQKIDKICNLICK